jgi:hypothetical protein
LFAGGTDASLANDVRVKAEFVRNAGGLHVALVHAGVFGDADAQRREQHRLLVAAQLHTHGTWMPRVDELIEWWHGRENLVVGWEDGILLVRNLGAADIGGLRVIIEDADGARSFAVPEVAAGQSSVVNVPQLPYSGVQSEMVLQ